jgi:gliding motility-associated-like protein
MYTVSVADANGCTKTASVLITQPATLLTSSIISSTNINCFGDTNGIAVSAASGGDPAYTYQWNPGGETTPSISGLGAGAYTVVISDSAGCSVTSSVSITQPQAISATILVDNATCIDNNGQISVLVTGGTSPYLYHWSPGGSTNVLVTGLSSGHYKVTVTDAHGCIDTISGDIGVDKSFSVTVTGPDSICQGQSATLTASGATVYLWNNSSTYDTITVSPTTTTIYWVKATTGICSDSIEHTVTLNKPLAANMPKMDTICPGSPVTLKVTTVGGKPAYTYTWNNGITNNSPGPIVVYPTDSTTYIVTITDACNEQKTDSTRVDVLPTANVSFTVSPDTIPGGQTVTFTNTSKNATSWYWTFGDGGSSGIENPIHQYVNPGTYLVLLVGENTYGCPDTVTKDVYVTPEIYIPNVFTPNGDGVNDVLYFTITGATCFHCDIFNRWGILVYQLNSSAQGWPGIIRQTNDPASDGTYYYIINYCDYKGVPHKLDGFVTLIRDKQ